MRDRVKGVSLIEVAIALLVLSIGALDLASLQISAKQAGYEALQRTQAASLAMDLIGRMRANPAALLDYDTTAGDGVGSLIRSLPANPAKDCSTKGECTLASEVAAWDMWEWERSLNGATAMLAGVASGGLVDPVGCVTVNGRLVQVEVAWRGSETLSVTNDSGGCGNGKYEANNANRQLLQLTTYIGEE